MSVATTTKYWVGTVSKEHVFVGVKGGFCQVCHGKKDPLARMKKGDWLVYYSPKEAFEANKPCQKFTTIREIADEDVYKFKMSDEVISFRKNITYLNDIKEQSIRPLLDKLSFTQSITN
ncbi:MAG: EVE domain-containing protein [Candidatus Rhabdochlamydia sp.]